MNTEERKNCPMRNAVGNCLPCGGFCLAVHDEICEALRNAFSHGYRNSAIEMIRDPLDNAPTIDAVPVVHARWEWREYWGCATFQDPPDIYDYGWACSACGVDLLQYLQSHFPDIPSYMECASEEKPTVERCPNCGAKMDGGAENG